MRLLVNLLFVFLLLSATARGATVLKQCDNNAENKPDYGCLYDTPGGTQLIGPGKESIASEQKTFFDGSLRVERQAELMRSGALSYANPNTAELEKKVILIFEVRNAGKDDASNVAIEQPIGSGLTYKIDVGSVQAGTSKQVSFSFEGDGYQLPAPTINYALPPVHASAGAANEGEPVKVTLASASGPLVGEAVKISSPSDLDFELKTDENGEIEFTPQEAGPYVLKVRRREFATPFSLAVAQKTSLQNTNTEDAGKEQGGAQPTTAAFLLGGVASAMGFVNGMFGATGMIMMAVLLSLGIFGGWVYYRMRTPKDGLEDEDVPMELARYQEVYGEGGSGIAGRLGGESRYDRMSPEEERQDAQMELTEQQKAQLMDSTVALSPRQIEEQFANQDIADLKKIVPVKRSARKEKEDFGE